MVKVLFEHSIFLHQKVGGISNYILKLNENLEHNKIEASIISFISINKKLEKNKNQITLLKFKKIPKFCRKLFFYINDCFFLIYSRFFKPNIIHFSYYNNNLIKFLKIPYVLTVYDLISEKYQIANKQFYKKNLIDNAKHIICISNFTKSELINTYDVPERKISVIHLGIDNDFSKINKISNSKKRYILFVGDRDRYKNFEKLVFAFASSDYLKTNFEIICFGGQIFNIREKKLFQELNVDRKIIQTFGDDKSLKKFYEEANVFVSVSLMEGFGLTLLEAMKYKCPVLCSDIPVFREILGNSCEFVDPKNPKKIKEKLEKILKSKNEQNRLIQLGIDKVSEYSWKKCAFETSEIYKKILNEK